ncbi:MAG: hypothetical protein V3R77_08145 [Candidatus Binatia bacterium]
MAGEERLWPIERLVGGIDELRTVLGVDVGPAVDRVKAELLTAMAARDRGDRDAALLAMARGMGELASLGDRLGAAEGEMMRAVTSAFIGGMARDDREAVERNLKAIESRAGTPRKDP